MKRFNRKQKLMILSSLIAQQIELEIPIPLTDEEYKEAQDLMEWEFDTKRKTEKEVTEEFTYLLLDLIKDMYKDVVSNGE